MSWKLIGRHKHIAGVVISEMYNTSTDEPVRRYVATIRGWRNFKLAQGSIKHGDFSFQDVCDHAIKLRDRIDANDEAVFCENTTLVWNTVLIDE